MDQSIEYGVSMSRKIDEVIAADDEKARNRQDTEPAEERKEDVEEGMGE